MKDVDEIPQNFFDSIVKRVLALIQKAEADYKTSEGNELKTCIKWIDMLSPEKIDDNESKIKFDKTFQESP